MCDRGQPRQAPTMLHPGPHGGHRHAVNALQVVPQVHPGHPGGEGQGRVSWAGEQQPGFGVRVAGWRGGRGHGLLGHIREKPRPWLGRTPRGARGGPLPSLPLPRQHGGDGGTRPLVAPLALPLAHAHQRPGGLAEGKAPEGRGRLRVPPGCREPSRPSVQPWGGPPSAAPAPPRGPDWL